MTVFSSPYPSVLDNRLAALEALREGDENRRETSKPFDPRTGKMCACVMISQRLGLPMPKAVTDYDYDALEKALGIASAQEIWGLNDAEKDGEVRFSLKDIADIKAAEWGLG
jgi:hypothetical protein